ncbi:hypothetical protein [Acidocella aromatica]|uniref:Uncharacterized protein n=1 Tax=Acidocella aromatica TaxID=1303579 RepID=A0A840VM85_9PROT|nr:hypothetical protein [Acidocella aromatica]MBB5374235.1 hypothetical protein [Acidocella aromatica]
MASNTIWVALISAGFVFRDAKRQKMPQPLAWTGAVLIFWAAALPWYLWQRHRDKLASTQPCTELS